MPLYLRPRMPRVLPWAVRFLGVIEAALQLRYSAGLTDRTGMLPFLRLPIADNPAPEAFQPAMIANLFRTLDASWNRPVRH